MSQLTGSRLWRKWKEFCKSNIFESTFQAVEQQIENQFTIMASGYFKEEKQKFGERLFRLLLKDSGMPNDGTYNAEIQKWIDKAMDEPSESGSKWWEE